MSEPGTGDVEVTVQMVIDHINETMDAIKPVLKRKGMSPGGRIPVPVIYMHTLALMVMAEAGRRVMVARGDDTSKLEAQVQELMEFAPQRHTGDA